MRIVVGTAGHIDHGKTALVRALTGIDTDRLEEEKRRGISIDLGFAHLDDFEFIDVPGHERFVKNMLAGASGVDLVLLVVAADESIKPQTREHFEICRLLGIERGVVALTKSDLVDPGTLDLARLEVDEFVRGSFLENAPVVAVSAKTGAGLDELLAALRGIASEIRRKDLTRYPRLPIDRSFSMRGHGAVVTGTLISGSFALHDEVELYPTSKRARIRALQTHGSHVDRAHAGDRTAVNLAGIDSSDARRGMTLAPAGIFRATTEVDCTFELLASAHPLKHRAPVHFHSGTAEVEAEARLIPSLDPVKPGSRAHVRFLLRDPLLILPGDRFIVRMFSPVVTIGGGIVIDIDSPPRIRRAALDARLKNLAAATPAERIALLVAESKFGMSAQDLVARTGFSREEIGKEDFLIDSRWKLKTLRELSRKLADSHRENPLRKGVPKEELRSREFAGAPPFLLDLVLASAAGEIVVEGDLVRLASHNVAFKSDESQALEKLENAFKTAGLSVPATPEVLAQSGVDAARARTLLQILIRDRQLIRVSTDLIFHASAIARLRALLAPRKGSRFSVSDFKTWTGASRKYAIPLLEFLDRERVTRREGDSRIVL
ncbi:MAG TPA: selenocysteine-specific translation elongation factor [Bryobacteraceae bacterium]|nr:selenocysteine-specific translation elongation factor [Bryobacteraceae bacterium]